jgi:hypothetical protein
MSNGGTGHNYQIGDAVLVHIAPGVDIPGVIEDQRSGEFQVRLAQPWTDEAGNQNVDMWAGPDKLDPHIEEETGGHQALPRH